MTALPFSGHGIVLPARWIGVGFLASGTGWRSVDITITEPGGAIHGDIHLTGDSMRFDTNVFSVAKLGEWRFRLSDDQAGCVREFSVEVVLVPAP